MSVYIFVLVENAFSAFSSRNHPSSTNCWFIVGSMWKQFGNCFEMVGPEAPLTWSVSEQDFERLTVGSLFFFVENIFYQNV